MIVTDLRHQPVSRRAAVTLAVLAVFGGILVVAVNNLVDPWRQRHDIGVDLDPIIDPDRPFQPFASARAESPDGTRFATTSQGRFIVVDSGSQEVVAEVDSADDVLFLSEDLLVASGHTALGGFDGLAVVDLGSGSVEQVDVHGWGDRGFRLLAVTANGDVEACELVFDQTTSTDVCDADRFLIDVATADLRAI